MREPCWSLRRHPPRVRKIPIERARPRVKAARRQLALVDPDDRRSRLLSRRTAVSVQDAASEWGFFHLSQFGLDYRRWFGELPSQTARRNGPR